MARSVYRLGHGGDRPLSDLQQGAAPILQALRYGATAPSAHNTQPWQLEIVSDTEARLYFDPARRLPMTDPPGRQVHIGHGTLLEVTAIAASSLGYRAEIGVLPEGEMSIPEFGAKPTATIRLVADPGVRVDPLFQRILHRRSSRLAHDGSAVSAGDRERIATAAATPGVAVGWVPDRELPAVRDIAKQAMAVEVNDRGLWEETNEWFRFSLDEIAARGDGLNIETSGMSGLGLTLGRIFATQRTWHRGYNRRPFLGAFDAALDGTRSMLTLATGTNGMRDWIIAGRAYVRAQLAADALGLWFHPVSQALQEFPQMDALRTRLEQLLGAAPPRKLQMLVRVGRTAPPALSPRRPLEALRRRERPDGSIA